MSITPDYYIGLPQWHHPAWHEGLLAGRDRSAALAGYAQSFNSVEGNTTFYGLPSPDTVQRWIQEVAAPFRFCFKFPRTISHDQGLHHTESELQTFLHRLDPLADRLGVLWLQLPAAFGPAELPLLARFLLQLPAGFSFAVEARHPAFFERGDADRRFSELLAASGVNRIAFDTRALFRDPADDPITREALSAKPRLPLRPVATAGAPMVRLITPLQLELGDDLLAYWVARVLKWIDEGRTPWLFFHTPDCARAPELAARFAARLHAARNVRGFRPWPAPVVAQPGLF